LAFLLCKGTNNSEHDLALGIHGIDVSLLEVNEDAKVNQLSYQLQAVCGISGKCENNKWTMKKKYERGDIMVNTKRFMGYDKNEYGELIINPEGAKIVQSIFDKYLQGIGSFKIAAKLNEEGIQPITGKKWQNTTFSTTTSKPMKQGESSSTS